MSEIADRVKAIIVDTLSVDEASVKPEATFADLDTVDIIMKFEKEFDIKIADDEAEKIGTVGDAIAFVEAAKK